MFLESLSAESSFRSWFDLQDVALNCDTCMTQQRADLNIGNMYLYMYKLNLTTRILLSSVWRALEL